MHEMYVILGWIGWIWLAIVMVLLPLALLVQHLRRQRQRNGVRGVEVNGNNEKQS